MNLFKKKELNIGGVLYKIEITNNLQDEVQGLLNRENNTILIHSSLSEEEKHKTLLHEIIHIINGEFTETDVDFFANALYPIIKEN